MKCPKLSAFLKDRASQEGLSVRALAAKIGISGASVQNYIDGTTGPSVEVVEKIAAAFGVKPEDISDWRIVRHDPELPLQRTHKPHIAVNGLTKTKVAALEGLAEKLKEIGDTEFYELMGIVSRALDELERKRLSGELKPPWQDEGEEGSGG